MTKKTSFMLIAGLIAFSPAFSNASPTIAGGTEVPPGHTIARTTVALLMSVPEGQSLCTGSILDNDMILTAAHCVAHATRTLVFFGTDVDRPEQIRAATGIFVPVEYRKSKTPDIALVRFAGGLPVGYEPAQLMPLPLEPAKGEHIVIAGYGRTSLKHQEGSGTLRQVNEKVVSASGPQSYEVTLTQKGKTGACPGDSGGPAFTERGHYLFGVASRITLTFLSPCGLHSIYTNAGHPAMRKVIEFGMKELRKTN